MRWMEAREGWEVEFWEVKSGRVPSGVLAVEDASDRLVNREGRSLYGVDILSTNVALDMRILQ